MVAALRRDARGLRLVAQESALIFAGLRPIPEVWVELSHVRVKRYWNKQPPVRLLRAHHIAVYLLFFGAIEEQAAA
jgi:hypothetical protein